MPINLDELVDLSDAISLADAAKLLAVGSRRPHIRTLYRWANPKRGYRARSGVQVVLQTVRLCNEHVTRKEWVQAFRKAQIEADLPRAAEPPQVRERTTRQAAADHRRAAEKLDRLGVR